MNEHIECIVNYAMNLLYRRPDQDDTSIKNTIRSFLGGNISFEEASRMMMEFIGSSAVIERLKFIMNIAEHPDAVQVSHEKKQRTWSLEEDERLIAGIYKFGLGSWGSIANFVGNRTKAQCSQRWYRGLDPKINKDEWTNEEITRLKKLVEIHGVKNWSVIAHEMGTRSDVQCRYKYHQLLKQPYQVLDSYIDPNFEKCGLKINMPNIDSYLFDMC